MAAAAMTRAGGLLALERVQRVSKPQGSVTNRAFLGNVSALRATAMPAKKQLQVSGVRAAAEKYQVIEPLNGDPFIGGLETPVTSSPLIAWYLSNLPAYRTAVAPLLRGVEIGLAHGYFLVGPFVLTGPLRNSAVRGEAGSLAAAGLVTILTICLTIYGIATFKEGAPSLAPNLTLTGRTKAADKLQTAEGWAGFTGGWFFGGISGVAWAYILLYVLNLPYPVK
jgi:photosystem I subunit 11